MVVGRFVGWLLVGWLLVVGRWLGGLGWLVGWWLVVGSWLVGWLVGGWLLFRLVCYSFLAVGGSDLGFKLAPNYLVPPRRT